VFFREVNYCASRFNPRATNGGKLYWLFYIRTCLTSTKGLRLYADMSPQRHRDVCVVNDCSLPHITRIFHTDVIWQSYQLLRFECLQKLATAVFRRSSTVIPRLTSDPANEFFRLTKIFLAVFWTRLTNMDSANECFSGCSR